MKCGTKLLSMLLALLMTVTVLPLGPAVWAATKLQITTQPKTGYTAYGETAKATVKAKGDGLKYTWYVKNSGASKYSKSSVTKSTYSATMTDKVSGRSVYCVVKDKKGKSVKSKTAVLRMKATITTEPKTAYARKGETAKVTVKAKGNGLKYTWYVKNAGSSKYSKSSVTKSTYSVTMSDKVKGRYVYCVVTDKYGKTDKSKTVALRCAATVTTQPKSVTVANGKTAKVSVKAAGDGLKYAWYYKNAGASKYSKSSVTKSTYSVTMSSKVNGRSVYCVVTDTYGKTDKSKTVSLKMKSGPLTITRQPQSTSAAPGDEVGFAIEVEGGTAPYTYELQYTSDNAHGWKNDIMVGVEILKTGSTVELTFRVNFRENYRYRIVVTDAAGNQVTSHVVTVEQLAPSLTITRQPQSTTAAPGDEVGFAIEVEGGTAPYTYQLKRTNAQLGGVWEDVEAEVLSVGNMTTLCFIVSAKSFLYQDLFCIVVTDAAGNEVSSTVVWVTEYVPDANALTITTQPENATASVGDNVSFFVEVTGGTAPYTYKWEYMSDDFTWTAITGSWATDPLTDTLSFGIDESEFVYHYRYRCVVTDANGDVQYSEAAWVVELVE